MLKILLPALLGLGFVAFCPDPAPGHGGGGGGHGGGGYHGGYGPGRYGPYYGGRYYGWGGGVYLGVGDPFWYNYGPGYLDYGYPPPPPIFLNPATPAPTYPAPPPPTLLPPPKKLDQSAEIAVTLPRADAKVWIDGNPMASGTGTQRTFTSPALEPGNTYSYQITASWLDNGQEVHVERTVPVAPGRTSVMDFTRVNIRHTPPAHD